MGAYIWNVSNNYQSNNITIEAEVCGVPSARHCGLAHSVFKVDTITKVAFGNFWGNGVLEKLCCPRSHGEIGI